MVHPRRLHLLRGGRGARGAAQRPRCPPGPGKDVQGHGARRPDRAPLRRPTWRLIASPLFSSAVQPRPRPAGAFLLEMTVAEKKATRTRDVLAWSDSLVALWLQADGLTPPDNSKDRENLQRT